MNLLDQSLLKSCNNGQLIAIGLKHSSTSTFGWDDSYQGPAPLVKFRDHSHILSFGSPRRGAAAGIKKSIKGAFNTAANETI